MNKKIVIFGTCCVLVIGSLFIATKIFNNTKKETKTNSITQTNDISSKVNFKTEKKEVFFSNTKDMQAYVEKVNTIENLNEAKEFIVNFLNESTLNKPERIIGCYYPDIRNDIIKNNYFPLYDETNTFQFLVGNIKVTQPDKSINTYTVAYDVILEGKASGKPMYSYNCTDTYNLVKEHEKIYIMNLKYNPSKLKEIK